MKVQTVAEIAFWFSIGLGFYSYFGYPLILLAIGRLRSSPVRSAAIQPSVSLIITVHNEERVIRQKLQNTLALDYPRDHFEIIVASDASTDKTEEIVQEYSSSGVGLVVQSERKGKEAAQRLAVKRARGEILVFTDASVMLPTKAVRNIVRNFADPTVGCVSSEDCIINAQGESSGENFYVRYEMWLRRLETRANSVVGLSGSFFAIRRALCGRWSDCLASDFYLLLNAVRQGYRGISDPESVGYYSVVSSPEKEFQRKTRTVLRGLTAFFATREVLNPFLYGLFTWQVISHKLIRWLVPPLLCVIFLSNSLLLTSPFYQASFSLQVLFYGAAIIGYKYPALQMYTLIKVASFFSIANLSIAVAWWRYLSGREQLQWEPTRRF